MLFVYTKQGGAVKYEKNSGGTLDFQRTPDAMCLASVAGKGGLRNTFPFKISLIQIPLQAHFADMKLASLRQVKHLKDGRLDVTNEEYGTDSSTHLTWYLIASTMANKIKLTQEEFSFPET